MGCDLSDEQVEDELESVTSSWFSINGNDDDDDDDDYEIDLYKADGMRQEVLSRDEVKFDLTALCRAICDVGRENRIKTSCNVPPGEWY